MATFISSLTINNVYIKNTCYVVPNHRMGLIGINTGWHPDSVNYLLRNDKKIRWNKDVKIKRRRALKHIQRSSVGVNKFSIRITNY